MICLGEGSCVDDWTSFVRLTVRLMVAFVE